MRFRLSEVANLTKIERNALVAYSDERMFGLVNDIERYPEYMPGCVGASVLTRGEGWLEARLELSRLGIKQAFTTRNTLSPPHSMTMDLVDGPFKSLTGEWQFQRLNDSACKVIFHLSFEVSNPLLALTLPKFMQQVASEQVDALCQRARTQYG